MPEMVSRMIEPRVRVQEIDLSANIPNNDFDGDHIEFAPYIPVTTTVTPLIPRPIDERRLTAEFTIHDTPEVFSLTHSPDEIPVNEWLLRSQRDDDVRRMRNNSIIMDTEGVSSVPGVALRGFSNNGPIYGISEDAFSTTPMIVFDSYSGTEETIKPLKPIIKKNIKLLVKLLKRCSVR